MPTIKRSGIAATGDALNGLKFKTWNVPTLVSLMASAAAVGGTLDYTVGSSAILTEAAEANLEAANQVVDAQRDIILLNEPAPPGEHFLNITALGTDTSFLLIIEALG